MTQDTKVRIVPLSHEHIATAAPLLLSAWQEFAQNTDLTDDDRFAKTSADTWLSSHLESGDGGFVATMDDKVVGVITYSVQQSPNYFKSSHHLHIDDVAVHADARRRGIGLQLEIACEKYATDNQIDLVLGEIYAYNDSSRAMMQKLDRKLGYEVWYKYL